MSAPSTSSKRSAKPSAKAPLRGKETPRIFTTPLRKLTPATSAGFGAIQFAEEYLKVKLHPWQKWWLIHAMELQADGITLRFRTVLLMVSRQNGKSVIANVFALYRFFVEGSRQILNVAQDLGTADDLWQKAKGYIEGHPELAAQFKNATATNGNKQIIMRDGRKWKQGAANRSAGRGLSIDDLLFDELREQRDEEAWAALTNTTIARENSITLGMSNAGDQESTLLNMLRAAAIEAIDDPETALAIFEWSAADGCDIDDRKEWAQANPSVGYGSLTEAVLRAARKQQSANKFRTENLCQYVQVEEKGPWEDGIWEGQADPASQIEPGSEIILGIETSQNRAMSYIAAAGHRADGKAHLEIIAMRAGSEWIIPELKKNMAAMGASRVVLQRTGAQASGLYEYLVAEGIDVEQCGGGDLHQATGIIYDAVRDDTAVHLGQPVLDLAALTAKTKDSGAAWLWDLRGSPTDIAPLAAATHALWGLKTSATRQKPVTQSAYETRGVAIY